MNSEIKKDYEKSIEFWNEAFKPYIDAELEKQDLKETAPSEKLYNACVSLGTMTHVLDYGCGDGWGSVIIASSGCTDVHAVDVNENAPIVAAKNAEVFGVKDRVKTELVSTSWISEVQSETYDGFFCSNVLDVIPSDVADIIIREAARVLKPNGKAVFGFNFYMNPVENPERKITVKEHNYVYIDGVLRLVSKTDEEWAEAFSPYFEVEKLEHFAWPQEETERRRLFYLRKKGTES